MTNAYIRITTLVLDVHRILLDTVVFVQKGMIAKSRQNEKQRKRVAMAYKTRKLPILAMYHVNQEFISHQME